MIDRSMFVNSNKKHSSRNRSFKRLFMPKFSAANTKNGLNVKSHKKKSKKIDKKLSKRNISKFTK